MKWINFCSGLPTPPLAKLARLPPKQGLGLPTFTLCVFEIMYWLLYFAQTVLEAQNHTLGLVHFLIEKTKLYSRLGSQLNARQAKVMERLFRAGPNGFNGGLSAEKYISLTKTSRATATRDLQELLALKALTRTGSLKTSHYWLNIGLNLGLHTKHQA